MKVMKCFPIETKYVSYIAIFVGIEAFLISVLNMVNLMACVCVLAPPENLQSELIQRVWSWFFYDHSMCQEHQDDYSNGPHSGEPDWVRPVPYAFSEAGLYNEVNQYTNTAYQIAYFMLNTVWYLSAILLYYGNSRGRFLMYLPFLIFGIITFLLDTVIGWLYIGFIIEVELKWEYEEAIFAMIFLFFRGFLLYFVNLCATAVVFVRYVNDFKIYEKNKEIYKRHYGPGLLSPPSSFPFSTIPPAYMHQHMGSSQSTPEPRPTESSQPLNQSETIPVTEGQTSQLDQPQRSDEIQKHRPFSYTNPVDTSTEAHPVDERPSVFEPLEDVNANHNEITTVTQE